MNKISILFFMFLICQNANAWTLFAFSSPNEDIEVQGWPTNSEGVLTFDYNYTECDLSDAEMNALVDEAMSIWNGVPTSRIKVQRGQSVGTTSPSSPPLIICDSSGSIITQPDIPGVGSINSATSTGIPQSGRLVLNSNPAEDSRISQLSADLRRVVVAHEIGHVLGLGHTSDTTALMYFDASAKTKFNLSRDDMNGISYLYPRNELGGDGILGCGAINTHNSSSNLPFLFLLILPALVIYNLKVTRPKNA